MNTRLTGIVLTLLLIAGGVQAELYECDGVWTNKPCGSESSTTMEEKTVRTIDAAEKDVKEKKFWVNDVNLKRLRAQKDYGLEIAIGDVEALCNEPESSLPDCRKAVSERENFIERQILEAKNIKLKEERFEKERAEKVEYGDITVVNNETLIIDNGDKRHRNHIRPLPKASSTRSGKNPSGGTKIRFERDGGYPK